MPTPPDPVTDLAWSPDQARRPRRPACSTVWTELLERLPDLPGRRADDARRGRRPRSPSRCPSSRWRSPDLVAPPARARLRPHAPGRPSRVLRLHLRGRHRARRGGRAARGRAEPVPGRLPARPGAAEIELHLTRWLAERFGLPEGAGGMMMTGGAMANFVGPQVRARRGAGARGARGGRARPRARGALRLRGGARRDPPRGRHARPRRGRGARDRDGRGAAHAAGRAGRGDRTRRAPTACARSRSARPRARRRPARSTRCTRWPTIARAHGAWLHVDAAYGGAVVLSDELRGLVAGIERADSIAVDPHKWLYTAQSAGCVLLRDFGRLSASFHADATYIWLDDAARHGVDFAMHGPQFSRGFAALKVWVSLLAHGRAAYGKRIAHDAALARYLGELVDGAPRLRADVPAAAVDLLLPLPPARLGRRRGRARPRQREPDDGDPRRRARVLLQRRDRRPLRPARLHRQLPHGGARRRAAAGGRRRARELRSLRARPARRRPTRRRAPRPARGRAARASSARARRAS